MSEPTPDVPTIHQAIVAVMRAVGHVGKQSSKGLSYSFRGIDAVINAVGPAFRDAGVFTTSEIITYDYQTVKSNADKDLASIRLTVRYTFHGPAGDELSSVVVAESFDSGDKATAKAMSVALRTCLLQILALPTDEPDPDTQVYERGGSSKPHVDLEAWAKRVAEAEALDLAPAEQQLRALWNAGNGRPEMLATVAAAIERWKVRQAQEAEQGSQQPEQQPEIPTITAKQYADDFLTDLAQAEEAKDARAVRELIKQAHDDKMPDLKAKAQTVLNKFRANQ